MVIMVAIDMHAKSLVCELGCGRDEPRRGTYSNNSVGHQRLIDDVTAVKQDLGSGTEVVVAYEASGLGYVLYDRMREAGYRCAVLAPTEMLRSKSGYKKKTDRKDCSYIYETIRAHVLAGNRLPEIWVPSEQLREDREMVRARFDAGQKVTRVKVQIHTLLKKFGIQKHEDLNNWTKAFHRWLVEVLGSKGAGFRIGMETLLRQLAFLEAEQKQLERAILVLSKEERYRDQCAELQKVPGVGLITAMTFLTEIGNMMRFENRKQVGSYLGLVPSTFESGKADDRKGRITRDGPYRVRSVLNQALWAHLRCNGQEKAVYDRIAEKNPKRKKKAVVAGMRRLGIRLWHIAKDVEFSKGLRLVA